MAIRWVCKSCGCYNRYRLENIFNNLMDEFKDEIKAEYLTSKIMDKSKRDVKTNTVLKRYK